MNTRSTSVQSSGHAPLRKTEQVGAHLIRWVNVERVDVRFFVRFLARLIALIAAFQA